MFRLVDYFSEWIADSEDSLSMLMLRLRDIIADKNIKESNTQSVSSGQ